jgi:hypothetical protein
MLAFTKVGSGAVQAPYVSSVVGGAAEFDRDRAVRDRVILE